MEDAKNELNPKEYNIRVYEGDRVAYDKKFNFEGQVVSEEIKTFSGLKNGVTCKIELYVKKEEREYIIDSYKFDLVKDDEIKSIKTIEEYEKCIKESAYGHYLLIRDLDFSGKLKQYSYDSWYGIFDFNGHSITMDEGNEYLFKTIYADAIIENLVLNIKLNNLTTGFYGIFSSDNRGTIKDVQINLVESQEQKSTNIYLLGNNNYSSGIIENFAVNLKSQLYGYDSVTAVCKTNNGNIRNGYVVGENISIKTPTEEDSYYNDWEAVGSAVICLENNKTMENIYTSITVNSEKYSDLYDNVGKYVANITLESNSNSVLRNVYSVEKGNEYDKVSGGPNVPYKADSAIIRNCYYACEGVFKNTFNKKIAKGSIYDVKFQNEVLNSYGAFNVDELVNQGYYPHVIMSERMPRQEYINLSPIETKDYIDVISTEILENSINTAKVKCVIHNPNEETITSMLIDYINNVKILSNEQEEDKTILTLELLSPVAYLSSYNIKRVTAKNASGVFYNKDYEERERTIDVKFFYSINDKNDWKRINTNPTENYILESDINFAGISSNDICVSKTVTGIIDGNGHTIRNLNLSSYLISSLSSEAVLKNIYIENVTISSTSSYTLTLVSRLDYSTISNVHLIGENYFTSSNTSNVTIAGICLYARNYSVVENCSVNNLTVNVKHVNSANYGGLLYDSEKTTIDNCFVRNQKVNIDFNMKSGGCAGGLVARTYRETTINNCYTYGSIKFDYKYLGRSYRKSKL